MRSGRLNKRITIQSMAVSQNSYGEQEETWTTHATVWAGVSPLAGRKYFEALQHVSEVTTEIRIRHLSTVTTKMRVSYGGVLYDIKSIINPDTDNDEMILMCKADS